jgi:hypothetical protein
MQVEALAPGGVLVVCFWPSTVEQDGPWAQFRALLAARSAAAGDFFSQKLQFFFTKAARSARSARSAAAGDFVGLCPPPSILLGKILQVRGAFGRPLRSCR